MEQVVEKVVIGANKALAAPAFPEAEMLQIEDLNAMLAYCMDNGVEDLVLLCGMPWAIKWSGRVIIQGQRALFKEELDTLLEKMTRNTNSSLDIYRCSDADFIYVMQRFSKKYRFRVNVTATLDAKGAGRGLHFVIRPANPRILTFDDLNVHPEIRRIARPQNGIVIVTGPTGSGKTTLLDSTLHAQATDPLGKHILVFGAPVEGDLNSIPNKTAIIGQSNIGSESYGNDLKTFKDAVRNSLRRHPDIVYFTEARDRETIEGAVLVSQTGHLCYTTTHTPSVHMTLPRMGDEFGGSDRVRVLKNLAENTRAIIHQRLLPTPTGVGRSPVVSFLEFTADIRAQLMRAPVDDMAEMIFRFTRERGLDLLTDAKSQLAAKKISEESYEGIRQELEMEGHGAV
ncbi:ATPase, T2SS/T4P/T4SS family [Pseudomonas aeruginosa]|nr:ATPase, T2SS/T4P/T4SS family [Pseudomonas aeruginosa]ELD5772880.1 Flp pilus assembly complex ATPase component TadA [Pseudomonas aeruginosa]ETV28768.1 hypothetical protein Q046_05685 [Pseudomonas aeruginosa BWHPSA041]ETV55962.1 hypothetical protein Q042_05371 [Pseudomonas aeruginosa BWHPSA037]MBA5210215.1 Flp pilus assembly complex ATPase component TadA [Pseudomonas aeruginosa]MBG3916858.1 Flp pilus assembly complex ATPase component TadA [Pseudomonas aeruginosa]